MPLDRERLLDAAVKLGYYRRYVVEMGMDPKRYLDEVRGFMRQDARCQFVTPGVQSAIRKAFNHYINLPPYR